MLVLCAGALGFAAGFAAGALGFGADGVFFWPTAMTGTAIKRTAKVNFRRIFSFFMQFMVDSYLEISFDIKTGKL